MKENEACVDDVEGFSIKRNILDDVDFLVLDIWRHRSANEDAQALKHESML